MLSRLIATFALIALFLPHEPDIGMGRPAADLPVMLERIQAAMFDALDKVRADLKANGGARGADPTPSADPAPS